MSVAGAPSERSPSYLFIHACITSTGADEHAWIPLELPENSRNSSIDNQTGQAGLHSLVRNFIKVTEDETVSAPPLCSHRPTPRPPCLRRRACAAVLVPPWARRRADAAVSAPPCRHRHERAARCPTHPDSALGAGNCNLEHHGDE